MTAHRALLPAEVALAAVGLATVVGFNRLFDERSFFLPVAVGALMAHAVSALTRRRGWGVTAGAGASLLGLVAFVSWAFYPSTTMLGLPTSATVDALDADLSQAWAVFLDVRAPAPPETGFIVALIAAIWIAAFLADWAAFRLWSPGEAIVPASALFIFASLLGADQYRLAVTGVFLLAVFSFQLLHRIARQTSSRGWINADPAEGGRSLLVAGSSLTLASILLGLVVGPALPGADDPPVIAWRELDGNGSDARVTLSPMVNIRSRLVDQADVEVFTVRADQPAYWRLTSLDTFDGDIWRSEGDYENVDDALPSGARDARAAPSTQSFEIAALDSLWLPAAFEPTRIDAPDLEVVYEQESSTLIVGEDHSTSDGLGYDVTSRLPMPDAAALAGATASTPTGVHDRYTQLPAGFSQTAADTAARVVAEAGATSPYEQALALQEYFRDNFTYDQNIDEGHGIDAIDTFLEIRRGYCEQFAGSYAAMARSIGLPARVAVGFTWGDRDPEDPALYHVTGEHAHAWPEVYLPGSGWLAFEPTPGRGAPGQESYTGVPPAQAAGEGATGDPATPTSEAPSPSLPGEIPDPLDPELPDDPPGALQAAAGDTDGGGPSWLVNLAVGAGVAVLALAVYATAVIAAKRVMRQRRRAALVGPDTSGDPERRRTVGTSEGSGTGNVRLAWLETTEALAVAGIPPHHEETHAEYVARVTACTQLDPDELRRLAALADAADYAVSGASAEAGDEATRISEMVEDHVRAITSPWTRFLDTLDPRPLLPRRRGRVVTRSEARPRLTLTD